MRDKPKLNFVSYVLMLYQSGLIALGKMPNPITGKIKCDLDEVSSVIELMEILEEKTKNNLTKEEERTMMMVMDTMRLNYLEETDKNKGLKKKMEYEKPIDEIFDKRKKNQDGDDIDIH